MPSRHLLKASMIIPAIIVLLLGWACHLVLWPVVHEDMAAAENALSPAARELLRATFEGIDPTSVIDGHVHIACTGTGERFLRA